MKKIFSIIMAFVCAVSTLSQSAYAFFAESANTNEQIAINRLAEGQLVELSDLVEIIAEYKDANLLDEGTAVCVDEASGCIQIKQLTGGNTTVRNNMPFEIVCTSFLIEDEEGQIVNAKYVYDEIESFLDSIDVSGYNLSATHTAYFKSRMDGMGSLTFRLDRVVTSVKSAGLVGTTLLQEFEIHKDKISAPICDSKLVNSPASNSVHTLRNNVDSNWYPPTHGTLGGYIDTYATFNVNGQSFKLWSGLAFNDFPDYVDPLLVAETE